MAKAEERQAQDTYERAEHSFKSGVGSRSDYDNAAAGLDRARAKVASTKATLELMVNGSRLEDIAEAEAELARYEASYQVLRKGTREEDKAAATANVAEAEANLREAETNLREATVIAPERCVVEVMAVRPGDLVQPNQAVARVLRADDLWVKAFVPSTELGKLRMNQSVEVTVDSYPGRRFTGQIIQIANEGEFTPRNVQSADERKHQVFAIKVRVADPDGVFKSGMAAEVFVKLGE